MRQEPIITPRETLAAAGRERPVIHCSFKRFHITVSSPCAGSRVSPSGPWGKIEGECGSLVDEGDNSNLKVFFVGYTHVD